MENIYVLKKRKVNKLLKYSEAMAIVLCIIISLWGLYYTTKTHLYKENISTYTVAPGETLWTIALDHKPDEMDTRKYVHKIMKLNEMETADIKAYQDIKIIEYVEGN